MRAKTSATIGGCFALALALAACGDSSVGADGSATEATSGATSTTVGPGGDPSGASSGETSDETSDGVACEG